MTFSTEITVNFHNCDPAGVLFYGQIFNFHHSAYEQLISQSAITSTGASTITFTDWFNNKDFIIPLVHSEANYKKPMKPGETFHIQLNVSKIGSSSFQLLSNFTKLSEKTSEFYASVKTTHVFVSHMGEKISIPEKFKNVLEIYSEKI